MSDDFEADPNWDSERGVFRIPKADLDEFERQMTELETQRNSLEQAGADSAKLNDLDMQIRMFRELLASEGRNTPAPEPPSPCLMIAIWEWIRRPLHRLYHAWITRDLVLPPRPFPWWKNMVLATNDLAVTVVLTPLLLLLGLVFWVEDLWGFGPELMSTFASLTAIVAIEEIWRTSPEERALRSIRALSHRITGMAARPMSNVAVPIGAAIGRAIQNAKAQIRMIRFVSYGLMILALLLGLWPTWFPNFWKIDSL